MKQLWFRARDYGWGWYPAAWQGWVVLLVWIVVFVGIIVPIGEDTVPPWRVAVALASVLVLLAVCWKTGERPSWRWAGKPITWWRGLTYAALIVAVAFVTASLIVFLMSL